MIDKAQTVIQNHVIEIPDESDGCKDYEKESKKLPAKFSKMGPFCLLFLKIVERRTVTMKVSRALKYVLDFSIEKTSFAIALKVKFIELYCILGHRYCNPRCLYAKSYVSNTEVKMYFFVNSKGSRL